MGRRNKRPKHKSHHKPKPKPKIESTYPKYRKNYERYYNKKLRRDLKMIKKFIKSIKPLKIKIWYFEDRYHYYIISSGKIITNSTICYETVLILLSFQTFHIKINYQCLERVLKLNYKRTGLQTVKSIDCHFLEIFWFYENLTRFDLGEYCIKGSFYSIGFKIVAKNPREMDGFFGTEKFAIKFDTLDNFPNLRKIVINDRYFYQYEYMEAKDILQLIQKYKVELYLTYGYLSCGMWGYEMSGNDNYFICHNLIKNEKVIMDCVFEKYHWYGYIISKPNSLVELIAYKISRDLKTTKSDRVNICQLWDKVNSCPNDIRKLIC